MKKVAVQNVQNAADNKCLALVVPSVAYDCIWIHNSIRERFICSSVCQYWKCLLTRGVGWAHNLAVFERAEEPTFAVDQDAFPGMFAPVAFSKCYTALVAARAKIPHGQLCYSGGIHRLVNRQRLGCRSLAFMCGAPLLRGLLELDVSLATFHNDTPNLGCLSQLSSLRNLTLRVSTAPCDDEECDRDDTKYETPEYADHRITIPCLPACEKLVVYGHSYGGFEGVLYVIATAVKPNLQHVVCMPGENKASGCGRIHFTFNAGANPRLRHAHIYGGGSVWRSLVSPPPANDKKDVTNLLLETIVESKLVPLNGLVNILHNAQHTLTQLHLRSQRQRIFGRVLRQFTSLTVLSIHAASLKTAERRKRLRNIVHRMPKLSLLRIIGSNAEKRIACLLKLDMPKHVSCMASSHHVVV